MSDQVISSGVTSSGLVVTSGNGLSVLSGGAVIDTSLLSGATMTAAAGSLADNVTVAGGASLLGAGEVEGQVAVRGTVSGVSLAGSSVDPSFMNIRSGGRAIDVAVDSGGVEVVLARGLAISGVVGDGGIQRVSSGGVVSASTVESGGLLAIHTGGASLGAAIRSGGTEVVSSGGFASGAWAVSSGGVLKVQQGANVASGKVLRGGKETVLSGGYAYAGVISGDEFVYGEVNNTTIGSGGSQFVEAGGTEFSERVGSGGTLIVLSGGAMSAAPYATVVAAGGVLQIKAGGSGFGIELDGHETIFSGGAATGTAVQGQGYAFDYGLTSGSAIYGGYEIVEAGGVDEGSTIQRSGHEVVASGGVVSASQIGGTLRVAAGGAVSGGLFIEGGLAIISGNMAAGQIADFYPRELRGTLELDNLAGFHAAISGFTSSGQRIDLGGFAFVSGGETVAWAQSGASGTLTVTDGDQVAELTLVGTYVASNFQLSNDGHGGTVITEPKQPATTPNSPAITQFVEAVAGLDDGRAAAGLAAVHSGGTAIVGVSPLVETATSGR